MMIDGYLLNTRVFNKVNDDKHQALKPLMREVRYHCRHCDSTVIFLKKC